MSTKIRLDHGGIAELLKSAGVARVITGHADSVASAASTAPEIIRHAMDVSTLSGVSDRARSVVTITHPGGLGVQAKHGTLTRAVAAAGLTFKGSAS